MRINLTCASMPLFYPNAQLGNAIFDTANWIGDILGATADLLSEQPTDSPYDYPREPY